MLVHTTQTGLCSETSPDHARCHSILFFVYCSLDINQDRMTLAWSGDVSERSSDGSDLNRSKI